MPGIAGDGKVFAIEYLPGQFDQRADSCAQCIQLSTCKERPEVKTARVYYIKGKLSDEEKALFDAVDPGPGTIPQEELLEKRLPEMPVKLVPIIEELWQEEVVGK